MSNAELRVLRANLSRVLNDNPRHRRKKHIKKVMKDIDRIAVEDRISDERGRIIDYKI